MLQLYKAEMLFHFFFIKFSIFIYYYDFLKFVFIYFRILHFEEELFLIYELIILWVNLRNEEKLSTKVKRIYN